MDNFTFYAPTFFAFGKDTENEAGAYVKRFGEVVGCPVGSVGVGPDREQTIPVPH